MSLFWTARSLERVARDAAAAASGAKVESARQETREVDERLDQLLLVCAAMWELICEKTNLTQEDLINRVAMIDARDGVADGKMTRSPKKCPHCSRVIMGRHVRCLYCGFELPVETVFKTI